ncbi:hypothetical protein ACI77O_12645 [Pseudomonas tritici]|uniref:hypothetical protein n=1 Tax=Pseudomonas tritici TaxID=2745518 RepID=UPI00387B1272
MVPAELLQKAVDMLPKYSKKTTYITWVNWRQGYQVKMGWFSGSALECYLDFKGNRAARDSVLKAVFEKYSPSGRKPGTIDGHGWSAADYTLHGETFVSVNDVADIATDLGLEFSVLYVQESITARPVFGAMGIPLVPGEMGKVWVDGKFLPYTRTVDACL